MSEKPYSWDIPKGKGAVAWKVIFVVVAFSILIFATMVLFAWDSPARQPKTVYVFDPNTVKRLCSSAAQYCELQGVQVEHCAMALQNCELAAKLGYE